MKHEPIDGAPGRPGAWRRQAEPSDFPLQPGQGQAPPIPERPSLPVDESPSVDGVPQR